MRTSRPFSVSFSRLIAGRNEVNLTCFRAFRAFRGWNVYPKNVNEMAS